VSSISRLHRDVRTLGDRIIRCCRAISIRFRANPAACGTIDKFIRRRRDGVLGAPSPNPITPSIAAARAACHRAVEQAGLVDDNGQPVKIRIGINSGDMLVGNIGSECG